MGFFSCLSANERLHFHFAISSGATHREKVPGLRELCRFCQLACHRALNLKKMVPKKDKAFSTAVEPAWLLRLPHTPQQRGSAGSRELW